jgi:uncharacterized protein (TIGR04255 family)
MSRFEQKGFIADFQEALRSEYPKASRENVLTYQLSPAGVSSGESNTAWRFSSKDLQWSVIINEAALTLETRSYQSMKDFSRRFQHLLEIARDTLEITDRLRLGLRYINEVRYPKAETLKDWQQLLNPEFIGFDAETLLSGQIHHTLQEIQVTHPDGIFAIRHGLLNGTAVSPLTEKQQEQGSFYLIDLDYYDAGEYNLDIQHTLQQMRDYNEQMSRFFRWTLSEKLYAHLEPNNAQNSAY